MHGGSLAYARLVEADLQRAIFVNVDLRYADVTNAALDGTHFKQVRVFGLRGQPAMSDRLTAEAVDFSPLGDCSETGNGDKFLDWLNADR